jgi:hypothetical protein
VTKATTPNQLQTGAHAGEAIEVQHWLAVAFCLNVLCNCLAESVQVIDQS